jgi:stress-induced morphogen
MQVQRKIQEKLFAALIPEHLVVQNVSHKHARHVHTHGVPQTGETHFDVTIVSDKFVGRTRVERYRMIHQILAEELAGPVHALAIKAAAPGEAVDV